MIRDRRRIGLLLIVAIAGHVVGATACLAATSNDVAPLPVRKNDACTRSFGDGARGKWLAKFVQDLCKSKDPDDWLAAYLITAPNTEGARVSADERLAMRAYQHAKPDDAPLLYVMTAASDCEATAMPAASKLTSADPENGFAWLTAAAVVSRCSEDNDETTRYVNRALDKKVMHDYGFDLVKLVARRVIRAPIPKEALTDEYRTETLDQFRFGLISQTVFITAVFGSSSMIEWALGRCSPRSEPSATYDASCRSLRALLAKGDSIALLAADPGAQQAAARDAARVLTVGEDPSPEASHAAMEVILRSRTELDFYREAKARMVRTAQSKK
jgi:hypothetical protein